MRTEIILQHGWAFDSSCWRLLRQQLHGAGTAIHCGERGYYGAAAVQPRFSPGAQRRVVVAHSFGLHLLDPQCLAQADVVVALAGFRHFHDGSDVESRRSRRVVNAMLSKLENVLLQAGTSGRSQASSATADAQAVLHEFFSNCFYPEALPLQAVPSVDRLALDVLVEDLRLLSTNRLCLDNTACKFIVVHGEADRIVSESAAHKLYEDARTAGRTAKFYALPGAGHALPIVCADQCFTLLAEYLSDHDEGEPDVVYATNPANSRTSN